MTAIVRIDPPRLERGAYAPRPHGPVRPGVFERKARGLVARLGSIGMAIAGAAALMLVAAILLLFTQVAPSAENGRRASVAPAASTAASSRPAKPEVEPLIFADVDPQTARTINAAVPFAPLGDDRPAPFRIAPETQQFTRALDCLASAMLYEAGDDPVGQAAVAQVVLNRMRHPAFPHSVCAVVYQGSERVTGCQFTFTCDGALVRIPSAAAWQRARAAATGFLSGETDASVGMATHYHTDWVHPYWSATLDKIARVHTHLFFRWPGFWGHRAAFASAYAGAEPLEPKLAALSSAHRDPAVAMLAPDVDPAQEAATPQSHTPGTLVAREGDHFIVVEGGGDGSSLAMQGLGQCDRQPYCKVVGWDRRSQSYGSPQNPVIRTVAFLYVSDRRTGVEIVLWDCARYNRPSDAQCFSEENRRWITFQGNLSRAS